MLCARESFGRQSNKEPSAKGARKFQFQNFKASSPHSAPDFAPSLPRLSSHKRSHRLHRLPTSPFLRPTVTLTKNAMCFNGKKKSPDRTPEGIEIFSPQFFQVFQHSSVNHLQIASPAINVCADLSISRFKLYNVCYRAFTLDVTAAMFSYFVISASCVPDS